MTYCKGWHVTRRVAVRTAFTADDGKPRGGV